MERIHQAQNIFLALSASLSIGLAMGMAFIETQMSRHIEPPEVDQWTKAYLRDGVRLKGRYPVAAR